MATLTKGVSRISPTPQTPASEHQYAILVHADQVGIRAPSDLAVRAIPEEFRTLIDEASANQHLEPALLYAVMAVESGFNSRAVSPKGASGLMQLMPETASRFGVVDRFDPRSNVYAGAKYLRLLLDQFDGNTELAVAAYNAGSDAVLRFHRSIPPFTETQAYVPRVLRLYQQGRLATLVAP